jgi:hypothetical protein
MKPHTYTFTYLNPVGEPHTSAVTANGATNAYKAALAEKGFEDCKILKTTFRRADTAKGANRAGGLDSNGKQLDARTAYEKAKEATQKEVRDKFEAKAFKDFLKYLDLAIENLYLCRHENNGAVLSMPIKELYETMKDFDPFK